MAASDFLSKAAKAVLKPAIAHCGFQEYSTKTYFRMCGRVAQFLDLQKTKWGGGDFAVNYFIFILVPHRTFIGSVFAGRFPRGKSGDGWWKSDSEEAARISISEVREKFESFAHPIFERTASIGGYIDELKVLSAESLNAHFRADIGCALACSGRLEESLRYVRKAEEEYRAFSAQFPVTTKPMWSDESANEMSALAAAIEAGRHESLIDDWYQQSLVSLKIDKKWKA